MRGPQPRLFYTSARDRHDHTMIIIVSTIAASPPREPRVAMPSLRTCRNFTRARWALGESVGRACTCRGLGPATGAVAGAIRREFVFFTT